MPCDAHERKKHTRTTITTKLAFGVSPQLASWTLGARSASFIRALSLGLMNKWPSEWWFASLKLASAGRASFKRQPLVVFKQMFEPIQLKSGLSSPAKFEF